MAKQTGRTSSITSVTAPCGRLRQVPDLPAGVRWPGVGRRRVRDDAAVLRRPGGEKALPSCRPCLTQYAPPYAAARGHGLRPTLAPAKADSASLFHGFHATHARYTCNARDISGAFAAQSVGRLLLAVILVKDIQTDLFQKLIKVIISSKIQDCLPEVFRFRH